MKKKIVLGITGSIAAFKAIQLISNLTKKDYIIDVILSESGSRFVTVESIQALTKRKVYIDVFDDEPAMITHVDIVKDADLFCIIPASLNTIGKLANGIADNMLTCSYFAATCEKLIAPAMNVHMYKHPANQRNIQTLINDGNHIIAPENGLLACGDFGEGKLASIETLEYYIDYYMQDNLLQGKKVLISAGPTIESMDPVRYMTNHSSGKMGYALAKVAHQYKAEVTLVSGPTSIKFPYVNKIDVNTAVEMKEALFKHYDKADIVIMSAAVSDYAFDDISNQKIKKSSDHIQVAMHKNPDILYELGEKKTHQLLVGFAMETENLETYAKEKLIKKKCDLLVANQLNDKGAGFGYDTNIVTIFDHKSKTSYPLQSKEDVAKIILKKCIERIK